MTRKKLIGCCKLYACEAISLAVLRFDGTGSSDGLPERWATATRLDVSELTSRATGSATISAKIILPIHRAPDQNSKATSSLESGDAKWTQTTSLV